MLPITVLIHSRTDDDDIMEAIEVGDGEGDGEGSDGGEREEGGEGDTSGTKVENDQVIFSYFFANPEAFAVFIFVIKMGTTPQVQSQLQWSNHSQGVHRMQRTLFLTFVPIGLSPRATTG